MNETYNLDVMKTEVEKALANAKDPKGLISSLAAIAKTNSITDEETDLRKQMDANKACTYASFIREMTESIDKGSFITGYPELDKLLYFTPGDFVILQSMSNHGKSTFISNLAYRFLTVDKNKKKNPIIIWITYESSVRMLKKKILNTISSSLDDDKIIKQDWTAKADSTSKHKVHENLLYGTETSFKKSIDLYHHLFTSESLYLLQNIPIDQFQTLITRINAQNNGKRPVIMFLDYFQIIRHSLPGEGWQKMKELAYWIERFAIDNDITLFAASQVNDQGDTREGKDIYNACTIDLDLFNHSHPKLLDNEKLKSRYIPKCGGKDVISITIDKAKEFECRDLKEYLLFDGFKFEQNPGYSTNTTPKIIATRKGPSNGN